MRSTYTYTYAELEVSDEVYNEIAGKLREAGYSHAFMAREDGNGYTIDMHGIGLIRHLPYIDERQLDLPVSPTMVD